MLKVSEISRTRIRDDNFSHGRPLFYPLFKSLKIESTPLSFFTVPYDRDGEHKRALRALDGKGKEHTVLNVLRGVEEAKDERTKEIVKSIINLTDNTYKIHDNISYDGITGIMDINNNKIIIELKDSKTELNPLNYYTYYNDLGQIILYYILWKYSRPKEMNEITKLIIFNINLGIFYTLSVEDLENNVDLKQILKIAKTFIPLENQHPNSLKHFKNMLKYNIW